MWYLKKKYDKILQKQKTVFLKVKGKVKRKGKEGKGKVIEKHLKYFANAHRKATSKMYLLPEIQ